MSKGRWVICCEDMGEQRDFRCPCHGDLDCPDQLLYFNDDGRPLGILIHDGGSSFRTIKFCPWCRAKVQQ